MDISATPPLDTGGTAVLGAQIGVSVMRKVLDSAAMEGEALVKMMNQQSGVGTQIDTTA